MLHLGQKVFEVYLGKVVEIVAIQEWIDSDVKHLVVEGSDGDIWEVTSYEVVELEQENDDEN